MASSTEQSVFVPPGYQPPFYTITPTDQSGTIVIVTAVCLTTALVSILVRIYVAVQSSILQPHWDDWAVLVALLLAVIHTSIVQSEAATGLGKTTQAITNYQTQRIQKLQYADQIFYVLSVWMSKLSATLFFYRLSPRLKDRKITKAAIVVVAITGIIAILLLCIVCDITQPWHYFTLEGVTCTAPVSLISLASPTKSNLTVIKVQQVDKRIGIRHSDGSRTGVYRYENTVATAHATLQETHRWLCLPSTSRSYCSNSCTTSLLITVISQQ